MRRLKSVDMLSVPDSKKDEFVWKIRRQIQQKAFEEKLTRSLLSKHTNLQYPEAIDIAVKDLVRKALEELKQKR